MLFSEAKGRGVMSTDTATTVGTVDGFLVDPPSARVVALRLKKTSGSGDTLHWEDLTSFGTDHVTVSSADVISAARGRAAELHAKSTDLVGKRILTDAGDEIGTVTDVDFDPGNGAVVSLITSQDSIYGSRLVGCGSYAVIVRKS
jgi:sporulation protein YlmC with PRC-barrel domain